MNRLPFEWKTSKLDIGVILSVVGLFICFLGVSFILPVIIALIYGENTWVDFLVTGIVSNLVGITLFFLFRPTKDLQVREAFVIVFFTWFILGIIGGIPFYSSGAIPSFTDAAFESISGLTTTGATILGGTTSDGYDNPMIVTVSKSVNFWRMMLHWLGGMGIIVLSIAIFPLLGIGGVQLFQAESSGPRSTKLTPRVQDTAKLLWGVYLFLTILEFLFLWAHPSMDWFDALCHSLSTLSTGGFSTLDTSVGGFNSAYIDWVITFFMGLGGINFGLHYLTLTGKFTTVFQDRELRFYLFSASLSVVFVVLSLVWQADLPFWDALRFGAFQTMSILTSTGFGTANYEIWPSVALFSIFILFFIGGCAGSTSGKIKAVHFYLVIKIIRKEVKQMLHPRAVLPIRTGDTIIENNTLQKVIAFFASYMILVGISGLILSMFGNDVMTSFSAALSTIGNIGPGLGNIGPTENFAFFDWGAKWYMMFLMIVGRLEIFTVFVLFSPSFWKR